MIYQRVAWIDHSAAIGITHGIISRLAAVPLRQHTADALRRDAVADPVYQTLKRDEVCA